MNFSRTLTRLQLWSASPSALRDRDRHNTLDEQNGRDGLGRNPAPAARQFGFAAGSTADPPQKAYRILLFRPGITGLFTTVFVENPETNV